METSLKTGFAQIFSCCPKNLSRPKFGGGCSPPRPPGPYAYVLHREKTVYIKTHKTAINQPMDHTGETIFLYIFSMCDENINIINVRASYIQNIVNCYKSEI